MKLYQIYRKQILPISIGNAWKFFSDPVNLSKITPSWLHFKIISKSQKNIYPGMLITYNIKPFLGIPLTWVTEITHAKAPFFFVDEQRFGPYRFWHHQHIFTETEQGLEMQDIVHYSLPLGLIGRIVNKIILEKKLKAIFDFRRETLKIFFKS